MTIDLLYLALLCAFLAAYLAGAFNFAHDFVAAFGPWLWAAYSGLLFLFYPLVQARSSQSPATFVFLLGRLLLLFSLSVGFAVIFGLWFRPQDIGEWQLGAFFLVVPALLVVFMAFVFGFLARVFRKHIM